MAQQTKRKSDRKSNRKRSKPGTSNGRGRNKSPTPKKRNQGSDQTVPERMYQDYTVIDPGEISDTDEPDVVVDIPVVKVDEIHFELDDLEARISLHAEVLDLVKLSVGVHAELGKVELNIKGWKRRRCCGPASTTSPRSSIAFSPRSTATRRC